MRKKKKDKKKIIILSILLVLLLILLVTIVRDDRKLTSIEKVIKNSITSISNFVSIPFLSIKNTLVDSKETYELEKNNIESLSLNKEILKENEELKNLLELNNSLSDREYINATVINRNVGYWFNEITINKGSNDNILEDMAVISSKGLIGKTIKVSNNTSVVKLLTNENIENKISVKIEYEGKFIYGLLSGYSDGYFIVDGISTNFDIKEGSMVTTSGLSDIFPSGILIGYVAEITTDNFDLAKTLKVKSDVDFNDIYYVTVLKRKVDDSDA